MDALFTLEQAFYTGRYQDASTCDLSELEGKELARGVELVARANIAAGNYSKVISSDDVPNVLKLYAEYRKSGAEGSSSSAYDELRSQAETYSDDDLVKYIVGKVLASEEKYSEALSLLANHHSLDCASLQVQIHLRRNRLDLAQAVVEETKPWAQDNIVFNLCEAWTLLAQHDDSDSIQNAFYIYEELSGGSQQGSCQAIVGQAMSQLLMGRTEEAIELLTEALSVDETNPEALADACAAVASTASTALNRQYDTSEWESKLDAKYCAVEDWEAKATLFDQVAAKYAITN